MIAPPAPIRFSATAHRGVLSAAIGPSGISWMRASIAVKLSGGNDVLPMATM